MSDRLIVELAQKAQDAAVAQWSGPAGPRTAMHVFVEEALRTYAEAVRTMDDEALLQAWLEQVVKNAGSIDPDHEHDWFSMWVGFATAHGRKDVAHHAFYIAHAFPLEAFA